MFKRNATPKLKTAQEVLTLTEAEQLALSAAELDELLDRFRRGHVVLKRKLHRRCVDRRCRRFRVCAAIDRCCLCTNVPPMSKQDLKRTTGSRRRKPPRL